MAFRLGASTNNNARAKATNAIVGAVDFGTTNTTGRVLIYSGTQPADPQTTATGTLLVTINFANPSFAAADVTGTSGLASGTAISAAVATTGTAGWFRVTDRNNNALFDGAVTATGGGGDMTFDNVSFVTGGTATINTMSIQMPM